MRRRARIVLHSAGVAQREPRQPRRSSSRGDIVVRLVTGALLLVAWWAVGSGGVVAGSLLPSPASVAEAAADLVPRGRFHEAMMVSAVRVVVGFAAGAGAGVLLAARSGWTARVADVLHMVPSIAWLPLVVLYGGVSAPLQVVFVAIAAFLAVLSRVARPVDTETLVSALRRAMARSWAFVVTAELLGQSGGLGSLLRDSQGDDRADRVLVILFVSAALAGACDLLVRGFGVLARRHMTRRFVA